MRDMAAVLFGREASRLFDPFEPEDGLEDRVRESGEWCQSTPGRGAIRRLIVASRGATRTFGTKRF